MPRLYLPLVPVTLAAAIAAASACSSPREPDTRLIPPALPLAAAQEPAKPLVAAAPAPETDPAPSAEEVKEFERAVPK
ncbi:hypothetical protein [Anaeromyxobacter sp. Fw109-5]|uniref:hypothetical protein n=1 Tax=Anaeromyxobacter sp. (strain Fw109-5) TaxID=404589 RepID=UPI0003009FFA|nr:hypothetical protein [Anaeromyxobacter sp. Fw109-5]